MHNNVNILNDTELHLEMVMVVNFMFFTTRKKGCWWEQMLYWGGPWLGVWETWFWSMSSHFLPGGLRQSLAVSGPWFLLLQNKGLHVEASAQKAAFTRMSLAHALIDIHSSVTLTKKHTHQHILSNHTHPFNGWHE